MNHNSYIEFIGDHADVVAILLTVLFFVVAIRLLMDSTLKIWGMLKRRYRHDNVSLTLYSKERNHSTAISEPGSCSRQTPCEELDMDQSVPPDHHSLTLTQPEDVDMYIRQFLSPGQGVTVRQGVYIDKELHTKISTVVGVVGKRNLTVGNYVDTVLTEHFSKYEREVKTICTEGITKIL